MVGKISEICFAGDFGYMRFHDLRHTFATIALQNGVDIKTVSDILLVSHWISALMSLPRRREAAQAMGNVGIDRHQYRIQA